MKRLAMLMALAAMVAGTAMPASAQRTGTRIGKNATAQDAAAAMQLMSVCAIDRRPDLVRKWLDLLPGSVEESKLLTKWSSDLTACLDSDQLVMDNLTLRFSPKAMRMPVVLESARKLLRDSRAPLMPAVPPQPWFAAKLAIAQPDAHFDKQLLSFQEFGHCVTASDWTGARDLILSKPDTPDEGRAVAHLMPSLGPCLAQDAKIVLTPANLRNIVAEPVYHVLAASTPAKVD